MTSRQIAQKAPYPVDVEAGKTYYWCACGQSKKQPFCDGSHKNTDIAPVAWTQSRPIADEAQRVSFAQYEHAHGLRLIGEFFWLQGRSRGTERVFDPVDIEEGCNNRSF